MRVNLAEARGKDQSTKRHTVAGTETSNHTQQQQAGSRRSVAVDQSNKPPVPPNKAAAVAKIREAIATAKRESCQDLSSSTPPAKTGKNKRFSVGY